jgi:hypothetical protein
MNSSLSKQHVAPRFAPLGGAARWSRAPRGDTIMLRSFLRRDFFRYFFSDHVFSLHYALPEMRVKTKSAKKPTLPFTLFGR